MTWMRALTTEYYTLTRGRCLAAAWYTRKSGYAASVHQMGDSERERQYGFATLEEAQAWCLMRLAELRRQGRCGK